MARSSFGLCPATDFLVRDEAVLGSGGHDHGVMVGEVAVGHRAYSYPVEQDAANLWYHDHTMGMTAAVTVC